MTDISVAIAIYNGQRFLEEQLESIADQSQKVDEIIIIDDCSTDSCGEIAESFRCNHPDLNVVVAIHDTNIGYARTFFEAIHLTTGNYIFLADQDDIWLDRKVETMCHFMQSNRDALCVSAQNIIIDEKGKVLFPEKSIVSNQYCASFEDVIKQKALRPGMSIMFSSRIRNDLDQYDLSAFQMHDRLIELIASKSNGFFIIDQCLTKYRIHGANTSGLNLTKTKLRDNRAGRIAQAEKEADYLRGLLQCGMKLDINQQKTVCEQIAYYDSRVSMLSGSFFSYCVKAPKNYPGMRVLLGDLASFLLI